MDVHVLEYMIMIEQEGSISKAALRAHISQSALSQNLSKIEKELGSPLFIRVNRRLVPTRIGAVYLKGAHEMVKVRQEVYQSIERLVRQSDSHIRIAADVQVYQALAGTMLPRLKERYPGTQFDILETDSLVAREYLKNRVVSAAFLCSASSNSMLSLRPLYAEQLVWCVPDSCRYQYENGMQDCELGPRAPFIYPKAGSYFRPMVNAILSDTMFVSSNDYEAETFSGMKRLMEQGFGITLLPGRMTQTGGSYRTFQLESPLTYQVYFAMPKFGDSMPELEALWEIARDYYESDGQE